MIDPKSIRKKGSPEKVFVGTRVTPAVKVCMVDYCERQGISVHAYIEALIETDLKKGKTR